MPNTSKAEEIVSTSWNGNTVEYHKVREAPHLLDVVCIAHGGANYVKRRLATVKHLEINQPLTPFARQSATKSELLFTMFVAEPNLF